MRVGDFKLIWRHEDDTVELYNLADDLGESKNLASVESERAAEMTKQLKNGLKRQTLICHVQIPIMIH